VKVLEGFVADAKAEIAVLSDEKAKEKENANKAAQVAQEAAGRAARAEERNRILEEYVAACQEYNALPRFKRMFTAPPVAPDLKDLKVTAHVAE
jgi:hypothetical protein